MSVTPHFALSNSPKASLPMRSPSMCKLPTWYADSFRCCIRRFSRADLRARSTAPCIGFFALKCTGRAVSSGPGCCPPTKTPCCPPRLAHAVRLQPLPAEKCLFSKQTTWLIHTIWRKISTQTMHGVKPKGSSAAAESVDVPFSAIREQLAKNGVDIKWYFCTK